MPVSDFLLLREEEFLGYMSLKHRCGHNTQHSLQTIAWSWEFRHLKQVLKGMEGQVIFEYSIPSLPKTIDVVVLAYGIIFVLEYKVNANSYNLADIRQTNGYALRLKYFHSASNDNWIAPVLVATEAPDCDTQLETVDDDMVFQPICANFRNLRKIMNLVVDKVGDSSSKEWEESWEHGVFKASPTIIDAARNVWHYNNVREFTLCESDHASWLEVEDYIANVVVPETKGRPNGRNKSIVFVTGSPGSGKTLVGLNISVRLQSEGASMLSGNDPLVEVLTTALKRDLRINKKKLNKPANEISVKTIIRSAYGYKKEIFEKRLGYTPGKGICTFKPDADRGSLHIIIFDEAQRAWDHKKMIQPGQTGRKYWQEESFPFSEPGLLLWDMNQREWGVFVCLVGGGQEINTGEAGICEWLETVKRQFPDWHIYISKEFRGPEYDGRDGTRTVQSYIDEFRLADRITFDNSLHLTACQRSNRSDKVSRFVHELLECNAGEARRIYTEISHRFPIYITRDVEAAKQKLRQRKFELIDRGFTKDGITEEIRTGVLMSSKAARMRPLGFEIRKVRDFLKKAPNWFLDSPDNIISSDFLEIAFNEFFVQDLELDLVGLLWDADFRYNPSTNDWDYYEFKGDKWVSRMNDSETQSEKRFYMKNAYRVLLTRARAGMIIIVPEGTRQSASTIVNDRTRDASFYDTTYYYLLSLGLKPLKSCSSQSIVFKR